MAAPAAAQRAASGIVGKWTGGGRVVLPSGDSEQATCRAAFARQTKRTFVMNAVCATRSARIAQTATLRETSPGTYAGSFRNAEYNITGSIVVSVRANRMTAVLKGAGGGSARISLTR